jgi:hypothetical protein
MESARQRHQTRRAIMSDGDFGSGDGGGDDGGGDGGAFDLNNNGSSLDEFVLFAAITEDQRRRKEKRAAKATLSEGKSGARSSGCLLPVAAVMLLLTLSVI